MKLGKLLGKVALGALILSAIPYQLKKDEETGSIEVRSLLWGFKKTPKEGEEKDQITFAIPASGLDQKDKTEDEEAPFDGTVTEVSTET